MAKHQPTTADERAVFVISVAAELAGVHPQTLRIYERHGLLRPQRTSANTRRYSQRDIERVRDIQELTSQGLSLSLVRRWMELNDQIEQLRRHVAELEAELAAQRSRHLQEIELLRRGQRLVPEPARSTALVLWQPPPRFGPA